MNRLYGYLLAFTALIGLLLLGGCAPHSSSSSGYHGPWNHPVHELELTPGQHYRGPAQKPAPFNHPPDPSPDESKVHGMYQSEWDSFTEKQKEEYLRTHKAAE